MSLTYTTYVAQISNIMAVSSTTPQFQTMLPGMIDYAEQRIYREIDLLQTVIRNTSGNLVTNTRTFSLPTNLGTFVTVQGINVVSPVGTPIEDAQRFILQPVAREYIDAVWNSNINTGLPKVFCMLNQETIAVGPWPDQNYPIEVIGTIRPAPLSSGNATTFLTLYLPDLFVAASMIYASGYQRDFGSQSDNPQQSASWEAQYERLFASANAEELRKRFAGPGWTSYSSVANPSTR